MLKVIEHEISVAEFTSLPKELLSYEDSSFLLDESVTYANIEDFFTDVRHYKAVKRLTDTEKLILFLTVVEERTEREVSELLNAPKKKIRNIKNRAIRKVRKNA